MSKTGAQSPAEAQSAERWRWKSAEVVSKCGEQVLRALRPRLSPASYRKDLVPSKAGGPMRTILTGFEPLFDAAGVIECGR
jgi:hypothetical protein